MMSRIVCWYSHGAASLCAAKLAIEKNAGKRELVVACIHIEDELHEPERIASVEKFLGQEVIMIKDEKYKASVDEVIKKTRYMSGPTGARCTKELKKSVRLNWQRDDDLHVFGFDTDEAERRVNQLLDNEPELDIWVPLHEAGMTKKDCFEMMTGAGLELPKMYQLGYHNNNPCTLDTRVTTTKGVYEIGELIDTTVQMYGRDGVVDAEVRYMGEQPVIKLEISKRGMPSKTLRFTPDHKWYNVSRKGKRYDGETSDLKVGDFLPVCDFGGVEFELDVDYVIWGFCVGDGSLSGNQSAIRAFGEKWVALESLGVKFTSHNESLDMKYLDTLPKHYKTQLVDESDRMNAKMSFLAGWFLADGSCNINGQTCISTSDHVDKLRTLLSSCGLPVTSIVEVANAGNLNANGVRFERTKKCLSVNFRAPKSLMLKKSHSENHKSRNQAASGWRVDAISNAGIQPVACATVINGLPEITLEDMILTGNCIGCVKASGAGYWNKIRTDFPDVFERRSRQEELLGVALTKMSYAKTKRLYPETIAAMERDGYKMKIDNRNTLRIPLRYLHPDAGSHKDLDTGDCGIICVRPGEERE